MSGNLPIMQEAISHILDQQCHAFLICTYVATFLSSTEKLGQLIGLLLTFNDDGSSWFSLSSGSFFFKHSYSIITMLVMCDNKYFIHIPPITIIVHWVYYNVIIGVGGIGEYFATVFEF